MREKQIEKEVNRQAVLFEEKCKQGQSVTAVKFERTQIFNKNNLTRK